MRRESHPPQRRSTGIGTQGLNLVPGTGLLAACVPGAFGGWLALLAEHGTWRLADVLEFAIGYAERGYPVVPGIPSTIRYAEGLLRSWPGSADSYLPPPEPGSLFRNPALAATYRRIVDESRGGSREQEIERARLLFYEGFVAETIDRFSAENAGLLTGHDLASWHATFEAPATFDFHGLTVCKTPPWGQGPVFLQQLALLDGFDLTEMSDSHYIHIVVECAKLAFADREAFYGDPAFTDVPLATLLSRKYNDERRRLVREDASTELVPGGGRLPALVAGAVSAGPGEPTQAVGRGDTVHLDIADRFGNFVSATPSGGWLQASPVILSLAGRSARALRCSGFRNDCRLRSRQGSGRERRFRRHSHFATAALTWLSARPAGNNKTSGRCTSSSAMSSSETTCRPRSTHRASTPTTFRRRSIPGRQNHVRSRSSRGGATRSPANCAVAATTSTSRTPGRLAA